MADERAQLVRQIVAKQARAKPVIAEERRSGLELTCDLVDRRCRRRHQPAQAAHEMPVVRPAAWRLLERMTTKKCAQH